MPAATMSVEAARCRLSPSSWSSPGKALTSWPRYSATSGAPASASLAAGVTGAASGCRSITTPIASSSGSRSARSFTTGRSSSSASSDSGAAMLRSACTAGSARTESGTSEVSGRTASGAPMLPSALMAASCSHSSPSTSASRAGTASRIRSWPTASMADCATFGSGCCSSGRIAGPVSAQPIRASVWSANITSSGSVWPSMRVRCGTA